MPIATCSISIGPSIAPRAWIRLWSGSPNFLIPSWRPTRLHFYFGAFHLPFRAPIYQTLYCQRRKPSEALLRSIIYVIAICIHFFALVMGMMYQGQRNNENKILYSAVHTLMPRRLTCLYCPITSKRWTESKFATICVYVSSIVIRLGQIVGSFWRVTIVLGQLVPPSGMRSRIYAYMRTVETTFLNAMLFDQTRLWQIDNNLTASNHNRTAALIIP